MFRLSDDVIVKHIDGGAIIVDGSLGNYLTLNRSGTQILSALLAVPDRSAVIDQLLAVFDVERARLEADVEQFVSRLTELGLVCT